MILDDQDLEGFFESGRQVADALRILAGDVGATPVADYRWETTSGDRTIRHMRRVTALGMIGVQEDGASPTTSEPVRLRLQLVSWRGTPEVAIVRKELAVDGTFWEMHVGDGNPRPIAEHDLPAGFAFVQAALEAIGRH